MSQSAAFDAARLNKIAKALIRASHVVIISHVSPDGDCVGSAAGLAAVLRGELGKRVTLVCANEIPSRLKFLTNLPGGIAFDYIKPTNLTELPPDALYVSLDAASRERLGAVAEFLPHGVDIKIDHHAEGGSFSPLEYVDGTASASGEIVFKLCKKLCKTLPKDALLPIYAAISADTSSFRNSNTTTQTFKTAAEIVKINPDVLSFAAGFDKKDAAEIIASSAALANMKLLFGGRVSLMNITAELMRQYKVGEQDFGAAVGIARNITGVSLSVTVKQTEFDPTAFKISTRSDESFDCAAFCAVFGGGGHLRAAGASITAESVETAENIIIQTIKRFL